MNTFAVMIYGRPDWPGSPTRGAGAPPAHRHSVAAGGELLSNHLPVHRWSTAPRAV